MFEFTANSMSHRLQSVCNQPSVKPSCYAQQSALVFNICELDKIRLTSQDSTCTQYPYKNDELSTAKKIWRLLRHSLTSVTSSDLRARTVFRVASLRSVGVGANNDLLLGCHCLLHGQVFGIRRRA
jgi:hypothetical protein